MIVGITAILIIIGLGGYFIYKELDILMDHITALSVRIQELEDIIYKVDFEMPLKGDNNG